MARGGNGMTDGPERRNGIMKGQSKKELPASQNGISKKSLSDIQIPHTNTLAKQVFPIYTTPFLKSPKLISSNFVIGGQSF